MKLWKLLPVLLLSASLACLTQGEIEEADVYKTPYAERMKIAEEKFNAAKEAGKTVKGVLVDGNTLFNNTLEPQNKPYRQPYTLEEYEAVAISAERTARSFF